MSGNSSHDDDSQTLASRFDEVFKIYNEIEDSSLSNANDELQTRISETISKLEEITVMVSQVGLFSSNEEIEELPSNTLKFLLLPFLLGTLTMKKVSFSRLEILQMAAIYFKDFLQRCSCYKIVDLPPSLCKDEQEEPEDGKVAVSSSMRAPTQMDMNKMSKQREEKIKRYTMMRELKLRAKSLMEASDSSLADEDTLRDYYLTILQQFCYSSLDELDSISLERNVLKQMAERKANPQCEKDQVYKPKPLRPLLLTRNEEQKKVFGAGYPSLPSMTVEEFYEQRVKEGWFPSKSSQKPLAPKQCEEGRVQNHKKKEETSADSDSEETDEKIASLRDRDEWRDTHRTGWGNTYNRS